MFRVAAVALVACLAGAGPALAGDEVIVYSDDFSAGLGEWTFYAETSAGEPHSYQLTHDTGDGAPAPAAHVFGDWDTADADATPATRSFGLERTFDNLLRFHLRFDWRAWSSHITTTRMYLELVQASDGAVLYHQTLISGSVYDTGWLSYPPTDLSHVLPAEPTDVIVRFTLADGWTANHQQHIALDNFELVTTELPPVPDVPVDVDDFAAGTEPWSLWRDTDQFSPTYALELDTAVGDPAPSARVMGSYDYSGSTRRYGLERTLPVTLPFVTSFDFATLDAAWVTFQLLQTDGTLRHTAMFGADGAFAEHDPVDLSANVAGLTEVTARIWIVGTDHGNPDNAVWIDDFAWTTPCDETGLFYEDADLDGFGDPDAPHPDGDGVWCYPPGGYADDATDCDDEDPDAWPGAEEDCDTAADEDCDGSEVDGLDADCPPPSDDDDSAAPDDDDDDSGAAGDDDDSAPAGDDDDDRGGPSGTGVCRCDAGGAGPPVPLVALIALGFAARRWRPAEIGFASRRPRRL